MENLPLYFFYIFIPQFNDVIDDYLYNEYLIYLGNTNHNHNRPHYLALATTKDSNVFCHLPAWTHSTGLQL